MSWDWLRSTYDHVAETYETRFVEEPDGKPRDRELLESFASAVADPVVEVGCGPGQIGFYVRQHGRRVFGADFSLSMAGLAANRLDGAVVADMRALPLAEAEVGGLVAFYSIIHVRRHEVGAVLREFARVLCPGGRVLFSAHEGQGEVELDEFVGLPVRFAATLFVLDELVTASQAAGLEVLKAERRDPYPSESTSRLYVEAGRPIASTRPHS